MRFSKTFIPTLREDPAEAEIVSHKLMVRAGLMRKAAAGFYTWLPFGWRALRKVENIVREEMDRAGCLEILMPILQPKEIWEATGRWDAYGDEMMRVKDRHGREFCLGPTHEEMITSVAKEIRSYKDLPKCLYQIQVKYRDEIRPRFGVMRSREFLMKDAYSFHTDAASLDATYERMAEAYSRIVERCGLTFRSVKAAGGLIGGAVSEEFMVLSDTGEDIVIYCPECHYAANIETASSKWHTAAEDSRMLDLKTVCTPGKSSIEDVSSHLGVGPEALVKTLILKSGDEVIAALVPGDKELNPAKLIAAVGLGDIGLFGDEDFAARPDLAPGYVGPSGLKDIKIVADHSLKTMKNFVTGANVPDHHYLNVNVGRDFIVDIWADLVFAEIGEACPECAKGRLKSMRGIEVGHIFQLGEKYSRRLNAEFVDENGRSKPFVMGCYGVGISRIVAAAIEQKHDENGIIWPLSIAPYDAYLTYLGKDPGIIDAAERLYAGLSQEIDVLYDDRKVSAGVKFSDADLLGLPFQIIVGKKFAESGKVEIKTRSGGERTELEFDKVASWIKKDKEGQGI